MVPIPRKSDDRKTEALLAHRACMQSIESSHAVRANQLSNLAIGAAIRVHEALGPGLLESAYEACLAFELLQQGLSIERQKALPLRYRGVQLDYGYRIDLIVEELLIIEIKAVEKIERIHLAQVKSYLRLSKLHLALLFNFNVPWLQAGLKTGRQRISRVK